VVYGGACLSPATQPALGAAGAARLLEAVGGARYASKADTRNALTRASFEKSNKGHTRPMPHLLMADSDLS
jgi:hypothetical protein